MRVPVILADVGSALLLRRIALARGADARAATALAAGYGLSLCGVLVSGYHCNTDPVYAMLCLLAVHLLQDGRRPLLGGLALGLAINVKLIPVLLILPLCAACRSRRELIAFLGGLAVMALPFVPPLLMEPAFAKNVVGYRGQLDNWGIPFLLAQVSGEPLPDLGPPPDGHPAAFYVRVGTWLLLAAIAGWALLVRRFAGRWDRYRVAAVTFALFLVLTPGFGVQYLVILAPLLYVAATPALGHAYGLLAGIFLLAVYWFYWDGGLPLSSLLDKRFPTQIGLFGLMVWGLLVYFLAVVAPRRQAVEPGGEGGDGA
jgi:hypothetical protein